MSSTEFAVIKVVLVVVVLVIIVWLRRPRTLVLGQQLAQADAMEQQRLSRRDLPPSPMPMESYADREHNLVNPKPVPLDESIRRVVQRYRASDATVRGSMRDSISMDEIYTLFTFAQRAAVFGMRDHDPSWIEDGLGAVAMMDLERMDPRDQGYAVAVLQHAATRAGANVPLLFESAAALAQPEIAGNLRAFLSADAKTKALTSWLLEEVPTGFIGRGLDHYAPTHDLKRGIIGIAEAIDADRYAVSSVSIAETLPDVWIAESTSLLKKARGGAMLDTTTSTGLMVFLVELPDASAANALRAGAERHEPTPERAMVGVSRGPLFSLIVASVSMEGETIDETPQTLQRFVAPLERVLDAIL